MSLIDLLERASLPRLPVRLGRTLASGRPLAGPKSVEHGEHLEQSLEGLSRSVGGFDPAGNRISGVELDDQLHRGHRPSLSADPGVRIHEAH